MYKNIYIFFTFLIFLVGCSNEKPRLGIKNFKLTPCPSSPNCVSTQSTDKKHFVEPITTQNSPQKTKKAILKILRKLNQSKIIEIKDTYIRVEFSSKVFGFVDDVEFYFPNNKSNITTIHMRSASRFRLL